MPALRSGNLSCAGCGYKRIPYCVTCHYCERCHAEAPAYITNHFGEHEPEWWPQGRPGPEATPDAPWQRPQWDTVQQLKAQALHFQKLLYALEKRQERTEFTRNVVY